MVTKEQAMNCREFHYGECSVSVGKRGAVHIETERWRANGKCKTWKTRPNEFRLPIKFGLYKYGYLTHENARFFHVVNECSALHYIDQLRERTIKTFMKSAIPNPNANPNAHPKTNLENNPNAKI